MPTKAVLFDMFDTLVMIEKDHAFYSPAMKAMHSFLVQSGIQVTFAVFRDAYIKARDALYEEADSKLEEPHFKFRIKNALQILGYCTEAENCNLVQGATDAFCGEFMNHVRIDEHAEEALRQLHLKYRLGVVSNFAIPECVHRLLKVNHLSDFFDVIIVSAAVNKRKPNPEIYQCALEKLCVKPEETVFVGDTVDADIKGPKEIGMKTVYIERRPQRELETTEPDQIIKILSELPSALTKL